MKYPRLKIPSASWPLFALLLAIGIAAYTNSYADDNSRVDLYYSSATEISGMDNNSLIQSAEDIDNDNNSNQRFANYLWLRDGNDLPNDKNRSIFQMTHLLFKNAWQTYKTKNFGNNALVPDGEGKGHFDGGVSYQINLNANQVKLGLTYYF